jgi:hypothetical protein
MRSALEMKAMVRHWNGNLPGEPMAMEPPGGDGVIGGSTIRFGDEYS